METLKNTSEPLTDVIFRKWRKVSMGLGDNVIAIFPAVPADTQGQFCEMYEHVGQHGGGDYSGVVAQTRLATPDEYASLKRELESEPYNYRLRILRRRTSAHRKAFDQEMKRTRT